MSSFPRSRKEPNDPPNIGEVTDALMEFWGQEVLDVQVALSRRVHYVEWPQCKVMFRANSGWDGPTPPETIVRYVNHLSTRKAPAPDVIPTQSGKLYAHLRDYTISVESRLPGRDMSSNPLRFFCQIGEGLAKLHVAAREFPDHRGEMRSVKEYVTGAFQRSISRRLEKEDLAAVEELQEKIENRFSDVLDSKILWLLCRGDVRTRNTLATEDGEIRFTDFDSAAYFPALFDLVMPRIQWRMGAGPNNYLSDARMAEMLLGYLNVRVLPDVEFSAYPVVWAAYYTDRITFLLDRFIRRNRTKSSKFLREKVRDAVFFWVSFSCLPDILSGLES